jgi:hypothetical protein
VGDPDIKTTLFLNKLTYNNKLTMLSNFLYWGIQRKYPSNMNRSTVKCFSNFTIFSMRYISPSILLLFSTLLLLLATCICWQETTIAKGKASVGRDASIDHNGDFLSYHNSDSKIAIEYPSNWQKIEKEGDLDREIVDFQSPLEGRVDNYREEVMISTHDLGHRNILGLFSNFIDKSDSDKISLKSFVITRVTKLSDTLKDFHFIKEESGPMSFGNSKSAYTVAYLFRGHGQHNGDIAIKAMEVLTIKGSTGYIFSYFAEPLEYDLYLPIIKKILKSFQIQD